MKIKVPLKVVQQDSEELLDPLFKRDKIGDRPVMNVELDKEENLDINHRAQDVINLTNEWIKRPFKLDPIPETVVFHAQARPAKGRGAKVIIPTLLTPFFSSLFSFCILITFRLCGQDIGVVSHIWSFVNIPCVPLLRTFRNSHTKK